MITNPKPKSNQLSVQTDLGPLLGSSAVTAMNAAPPATTTPATPRSTVVRLSSDPSVVTSAS